MIIDIEPADKMTDYEKAAFVKNHIKMLIKADFS